MKIEGAQAFLARTPFPPLFDLGWLVLDRMGIVD